MKGLSLQSMKKYHLQSIERYRKSYPRSSSGSSAAHTLAPAARSVIGFGRAREGTVAFPRHLPDLCFRVSEGESP
jgi:hypothetical protein